MKSEKAIISAKDYSLNKKLSNELTMTDNNPNKIYFQWHCSFCQCELLDGGLRFNGVGTCEPCDALAHFWVNSLREHTANCFTNSEAK